jgi:hypothetical protein
MRKVFEGILKWFRKPKRSRDVSITCGGSVTHVVLTDGDNFWPLPTVANDHPGPTIPPHVVEIARKSCKEDLLVKLNIEYKIDEDEVTKLIYDNFDKGYVIIRYSNTQVAEKLIKFVEQLHPSFKCNCSSIFFIWVIIITWNGTTVSIFSSSDIGATINSDGKITRP